MSSSILCLLHSSLFTPSSSPSLPVQRAAAGLAARAAGLSDDGLGVLRSDNHLDGTGSVGSGGLGG